jgi:energy-coupling factor transporter ATP-binding protein EcfA2
MAKKKPTAVSRVVENTGGNNKTADQPGYFLSLTVRNVRCFGDIEQTLDLSDGKGRPAQWTILLGDNGTGKTTLLQALATAPVLGNRAIRETDIGEVTVAQMRSWLSPPNHPLFRGGGQEEAQVSAVVVLAHDLGAPSAGCRRIISSFYQFCDGFTEIDSIAPVPPDGGSYPTLLCIGYGACRRLGSGGLTTHWRENSIAGLFTDEVPLRNAEEWLAKLDWAAAQPSRVQARQKQQFEQVKELLVRILPDDVEEIRVTTPERETDRPRFEFKTPYGWVPLKGIGYGYQTMIAWMVDFASRMVERYPDSPDPLAEPAVVLVDEIDLHLHPRWQRELMGYLSERFPNTQFIATAHSPLIVQAAPSVNANIAVLRRDGDHVVIDNKPESIRGWRVDQILTSDIYDLPTARPKEFDEAIQRRTQILGKSRLTKRDREELARLEKKLDQLPAGETASEARKLMELAKDTAELLKKHRG